jgi:hypothetical protein
MDFFFQKKGFSPDTFGAKEVLGIFQKSGSIAEVVILSKGDQCGQQFGSHGSEFLVTGYWCMFRGPKQSWRNLPSHCYVVLM